MGANRQDPSDRNSAPERIAPSITRGVRDLGATTEPICGRDQETACWNVSREHLGPNQEQVKSGTRSGHFDYFACGRQSEMKRCAPSVVRLGPQTATMGLDNGAADG